MSKCFCFLLIIFLHFNGIFSVEGKSDWNVKFSNDSLTIQMTQFTSFNLTITNLNKTALIESKAIIRVRSRRSKVVKVSPEEINVNKIQDDKYFGVHTAEGVFIGHANIYVEIHYVLDKYVVQSSEIMKVNVNRHQIVIIPEENMVKYQQIRIYLSALVFTMIGANINYNEWKNILRKPFGLGCAFFINFILFPLVSNFSLGLKSFE